MRDSEKIRTAQALAEDFKVKFSTDFDKQATQVIASIDGSMPDIHLMKTVEAFGTGSAKMRLMVATDVASEGINLHHECHNIIHYDLPWSIITLIQRNGRIDRFGQKHNPQLRYLMVETADGLLSGDRAIFDRLITKIEEINRSRCSGESVLKLYDEQAEEEYIARQGIIAQDKDFLEEKVEGTEEASDFGDMFAQAMAMANQYMNDEQEEVADTAADAERHRLRLFSDKDFLVKGYDFLREKEEKFVQLEHTAKQVLCTPPADLRRRLGDPGLKEELIYGASAIPEEAWPENNQFQLSDDVDMVNRAIEAARNSSGLWSQTQLCSDQHPILKWIGERTLMQLSRGQAPYIISNKLQPGEICFCFIGQLCSKAGTPVLSDAHSVTFRKDGESFVEGLHEVAERAGFTNLTNTGQELSVTHAKLLLQSAVTESYGHLKKSANKRLRSFAGALRREERRLKKWEEQYRVNLMSKVSDPNNIPAKTRQKIEDMEKFLIDRRENWMKPHFQQVSDPVTRLVLVIEGRA